MLKNIFLTAIRALLKSRTSAAINILGLSIGIATCTLILIYVKKEMGYDKFHSNYENIFRLYTIDEALGVSSNSVGITMAGLPAAAHQEIPEVQLATRVMNPGRIRMSIDDNFVYSENAKFVESPFFEIFDYKVKNKDALEAFKEPNKAILTESMANTMFGNSDAVGKLFKFENNDWEVVGIVEDLKERSHLKLDVLLSMYPTVADSSFAQYLNSFQGLGMIGYVMLDDPKSEKTVEEKLKAITSANQAPEFWQPHLQPLKDVHLKSSFMLFDNYNSEKGDITYVLALSAIAIFIILIAGFNFMNLSTAQSSARSKEVGVRKVMGAFRSDLIFQHLSESVIVCMIAGMIAVLLVEMSSPFIDLGIEGSFFNFIIQHPEIYITLFAAVILIGILSGIYPAFILSNFDPVKILRGKFQTSSDGIMLRKVLVVAQFVASISMIIGTVLVFKQLEYMKNKNLGFSKDQIVTVAMNEPGMGQRMASFRDKLKDFENIEKVAVSTNMPGRTFGRVGVTPEGSQEGDQPWIVSAFSVDHNYLDLMQMELFAGRNYSQESGTDQQQSIIVNEAFANQLGWSDPVGKSLTTGGNVQRTIIGVVKNFHYASMRHSIEPLLIYYNPNTTANLSFLIKGDKKATMATVENVWKEVYPDFPFNYQFFDQEFEQIFKSDESFSKLISSFTWLAIFIACMGLFGLSAYMAEQRKKEIGVRRILGSSTPQLVYLLSREFMILIIVATALAWPIAYYYMENWLEGFQYKINLLELSNMTVFVLAGVAALVIGLLTVSYQAIAAALVNPVKTLSTE
jgi:putative ABC transport system permease protein